MTSYQIAEWVEYSKIEPFGGLRDDFRAGQVCATIGNVHRDSKRHPDPFIPSDFMATLSHPEDDAPILLDDPDQQSEMIKVMFKKADK